MRVYVLIKTVYVKDTPFTLLKRKNVGVFNTEGAATAAMNFCVDCLNDSDSDIGTIMWSIEEMKTGEIRVGLDSIPTRYMIDEDETDS